jgi:hypothetical protein
MASDEHPETLQDVVNLERADSRSVDRSSEFLSIALVPDVGRTSQERRGDYHLKISLSQRWYGLSVTL